MRGHRRAVAALRRAAWPIAVGSGLLTVVALVLYARNAAALGLLDRLYVADVWVGLLLPPIGAVLVRRPSTSRLGVVLLSGATLALTNAAGQYATFVVAVRGHSTLASDVASWVAAWAWTPYLLIPTLVPVLFPTGQPMSRRWSAFAQLVVVLVIVTTILWAVAPGRNDGFPHLHNPFAVGSATWLAGLAGGLTALVTVVLIPVSVLAAGLRWRRSRSPERQRLMWFVVAVALSWLAMVMTDGLPYPWPDVLIAVSLSFVLVVVVLTSQARDAAVQLQESREALVRAREAERLRLHRDLHDGLGPELAGIALQVAAAAQGTPDRELREQLQASHARLRELTGGVRHIVEGLRPEALDSVGLVEALRQHADMLSASGGFAVEVAADSVTTPPAAVEVAAFRIAMEAMTNAVRHSGGSRCAVRLHCDGDDLVVEVDDDGVGGAQHRPGGTGLSSMQARAEELGGWLRVTEASLGGTRVVAHLPRADR